MLQISSYFGHKENACLSLPQAASLTAPSSEGAKGLFLLAEMLPCGEHFLCAKIPAAYAAGYFH